MPDLPRQFSPVKKCSENLPKDYALSPFSVDKSVDCLIGGQISASIRRRCFFMRGKP